jgi:hypothetical protein
MLEIDVEATSAAPPARLFALLADARAETAEGLARAAEQPE